MVWRVVIIDDDASVLRGMKKIIPWEKLRCQWVGEAKNGLTGLNVVRTEQPDLIITDIYMPKKNGLDMIRELRAEGYEGKVIILSGYSDFEYARAAMRLNIDDYLSKPASRETIENVLTKIIADLKEQKLENLEYTELREKIQLYEPIKEAIEKLPHETLIAALETEKDKKNDDIKLRSKSISLLSDSIKINRELYDVIRYADNNRAYGIIDTIFDQLTEKTFHKPSALHLGIEMWTLMTYSLYDIGIHIKEMFPENYNVYQILSNQRSWDDLSETLKDIVFQICSHPKRDENLKHRQLVERTFDYIEERLGENITLNDIADELLISRNYLGTIFKKVTGDSFKDYLTRIRMKKAKQMILKGNYLMYEVSEKVGYKTPAYFSTIFKKYTGFTPTELIQSRNQKDEKVF